MIRARSNSGANKFHLSNNSLVGETDDVTKTSYYRGATTALDKCCFCGSKLKSGDCRKRGCRRNKFLFVATSRAQGMEVQWPE